MNPADLDEYLERTVRVPSDAMAALVAKSARTTGRRNAYTGYAPVHAPMHATVNATPRALGRGDARLFGGRRFRQPIAVAAIDDISDDPAMRRAVIGIWTVAAVLFAALGVLVK